MLSLKDQIGNTPLHYCVTGRRDDMLSVLVQNDVDLGVINQDGFNAIQLAAMQNSSSALKVILSEPVLANRYISKLVKKSPSRKVFYSSRISCLFMIMYR